MKKILIGFLLIAFMMGSIFAQGQQAVPEAETGELKGSIRFVSGETDPEQVEVHKEIVAEFERLHPGVKINFELTGFDDREKKIIADLYAGVPTDVIQVDSESAGLYAQEGILMPLDDLVKDIGEDDFIEGARLVVNDHDYAMPYSGANMMMYVRTDLLEAAGLEIPKTWEELLAAVKVLTKGDTYGIVLPAGQNNATTLWLQVFINQAGGNVFNENLEPTLNTLEVIEALTFYRDLAKYCPPGIASYGYGDVVNAFVSGKVAIAFYQGRIIQRVANDNPEIDKKYELVAYPTKDGLDLQFASCVYYAIGKNCENPELAKAFLKYLTTEDRALRVSMSAPGHMPPVLKSVQVLADTYNNPFVQSHLDKIKFSFQHASNGFNEAVNAGGVKGDYYVRNGIINPYYAYVRQYNVLSKMVQKVVLENQDPAQVAAEGQKELSDIIANNK